MPAVIDEKKYGRMLAKHLPAVIESDAEQDRLADILLHLTVPERKLSPEEDRMVALLERLLDDYEDRTSANKIRRFTPVERLAYLMEEHGLRQADLAEIFGGQPVVSAVLSGKRPIHLEHARKLARRLGLRIEAFLP